MFRAAFAHTRCLVPADAYYQLAGRRGRRQSTVELRGLDIAEV
jgi:putative SOS response-associated peptidase YedK